MTPIGWIWLSLAGAVGTVLRYLVGGWLGRLTGGTFPWGTAGVNVAGCLIIGLLAGYADRGGLLSPVTRMSLMVGFVGGFTTFSSYGLETIRLLSAAQWGAALAYVALTNGAGFLAVWAGYRLGGA